VPAEQPRIGGWAELAGDRAALGRLAGVSVPAARHLAELLALERAGLAAAHGTSLVHFDVLPHNILCAGHQVWFVDWPHARLGAPFIDLLMLLGSAGSDGIDLDDLLAAQPVAAGPDRGTIDAVLAALAGFYLAGALAETAAAFRPIAAAKLELGRGTLSWLQRRLGWRA
jgi:aminoglycoside phosphotransferase (APT) family kinase protein